jgi:hypothetical protein
MRSRLHERGWVGCRADAVDVDEARASMFFCPLCSCVSSSSMARLAERTRRDHHFIAALELVGGQLTRYPGDKPASFGCRCGDHPLAGCDLAEGDIGRSSAVDKRLKKKVRKKYKERQRRKLQDGLEAKGHHKTDPSRSGRRAGDRGGQGSPCWFRAPRRAGGSFSLGLRGGRCRAAHLSRAPSWPAGIRRPRSRAAALRRLALDRGSRLQVIGVKSRSADDHRYLK